MNKDNNYSVATLRCIAIISLVVWHSYCSYVRWGIAETPLNGFYTNLFKCIIPDANMPLFTFIAGYLWGYLYHEEGKYRDFKSFLIKKVNRLLIPFLILGTVINLLEYGKDIKDILYGAPNHLWYCLMLFYVFIACWLIERYLGEKINLLFTFVSFAIVTYYGVGALSHRIVGGLFLPIYYYGYFYLGVLFNKYKDKYANIFPDSAFFILFIYVLTCIFRSDHLIVIRCVSFAVLLYTIVNLSQVKEFLFHKPLNKSAILLLSKYSFGIYVFTNELYGI